MIIRRAQERGHFKNEWLDSYHSFSFSDYYDSQHMNFRALRVINHDLIQPGTGFGKHPHRDMEIITYVLQGAVEHEDSLGNKAQIQTCEVQVMSAGTGILHSESNPSPDTPLELLQIWVVPRETRLNPSYNQRLFTAAEKNDQWKLLISPDGRDQSLMIHQNALIWTSILNAGHKLSYDVLPGRGVWLQVAQGELSVNGQNLKKGDGISIDSDIDKEEKIEIEGLQKGEFLLFDMGPY